MFFAKNKETRIISVLTRKRVFRRRMLLFSLTGISTFWATFKWSFYMPTDVNSWIHWTLVVLFAMTFGWIALYFWSALLGFRELVRHKKYEGIIRPDKGDKLNAKTAVLVPTYNENPIEIYARILSMAHDLSQSREGRLFDFFILSDTTKPSVWVEEENLWLEIKKYFPKEMNVFYRHRPKNTARKSGNIEDFCIRWGNGYDFMLVLDADSLMTAETVIQMARWMLSNPTTGIIQAPPKIINSGSFFARMNQFAGRVYGQIITTGLAYWQAWDSNYWGHNAIIRTEAFIESCGLPVFKGKAPFGGHILSHDFVEAALIRRAGWLAWMLPELSGSYEECPPAMLDFATRDRRWCQGNLQHLRILLSKKFHPISRIHFTLGIMSYLSSPLWFLFLVLGTGIAVWRYFYPPAYFTQVKALFPTWPVFNVWGTVTLFAFSMLMLFFPKILGVGYAMKTNAKGFGGKVGLFAGFIVENIFSALIAPIMMLFQTKFVAEILLGLDSGWKTQNRTEGTSWGMALRRHGIQTLVGIGTQLVIYRYARGLFYWMLPITTGLVLSVPLSVLSSKVSVGKWFKKLNIFMTPEEKEEPNILRETKENIRLLEPVFQNKTTLDLLGFPQYLGVHLYLLSINGPPPEFEEELKEGLSLKVQKYLLGEEELNLTQQEENCILYQESLLKQLILLLSVDKDKGEE